jgi:hypothetical protein
MTINDFVLLFYTNKYNNNNDTEELIESKKLVYNLSKIRKLSNIYNSDLIIKIIAILSDNNLFKILYKEIFESDKESKTYNKFVDLFFINCNKYKNIINLASINNIYIERDTYIYNLHNKNNTDEYIYIFTIINKIYISMKENIIKFMIGNYFDEIIILITEIVIKIRFLLDEYKLLYDKYLIIDDKYDILINKTKKIFTYIKERSDEESRKNPRYIIKYNELINKHTNNCNINCADKTKSNCNNKYLSMKYYNLDGTYGFTNNIYNHNTYKKELENKISVDKILPEYYYLGPFDNIYSYTVNNKNIACNMSNQLFNKLINNYEDICIIGYGQSGSGKTGTFSIGVLQNIDISQKRTQALILAPTHELAKQISNVITNLGNMMEALVIFILMVHFIHQQVHPVDQVQVQIISLDKETS